MEPSSKLAPGPGRVVLFGSGETSPSARKALERVFKDRPVSQHMALLETPAGFELNSERVIARVAEYIAHHLQNYNPQMTTIPARKRGSHFSPDSHEICAPILEADLVFMGPGSPTYTVRQLKDSLAWHYLLSRHRLGADLILSSAAVIAISLYALPVYEIYKVGEELHWKEGLDFFGKFGLPLVFIPHWNNNEGGEGLDTSRCFMGQSRFMDLMEMLPPDITVLGIDEHTTLTMDIQAGLAHVDGRGGVTFIHTGHSHPSDSPDSRKTGVAELADLRQGHEHRYMNKETFLLSECCPFELPSPGFGIPLDVWNLANQVNDRLDIEHQIDLPKTVAPPEIQELISKRQDARQEKDWAEADAIRQRIMEMGWQVIDTPEGPQTEKL